MRLSKSTIIIIYAILSAIIYLHISCSKDNKIIDIDPPELLCATAYHNGWILSFDEPVQSISAKSNQCSYNQTYRFPTPQVFICFEQIKPESNTQVFVIQDKYGNIAESSIELPFININPAKIEITVINIYSSPNSNQFIKIKKDNGLTDGYILSVFGHTDQFDLTIKEYFPEESFSVVINNKNLSTNTEIFKLTTTYGLIIIKDNNNVIRDYLLYYDSSKNEADKITGRRRYGDFIRTLNNGGITNPVLTDIRGTGRGRPFYKPQTPAEQTE